MAAWRWTLADSAHQRYLDWTGIPIQYDLRSYLRVLAQIGAVRVTGLPDGELKTRAGLAGRRALAGEGLDALLPEVYALVREACHRVLAMRPFDVQTMAAVALHQGRLAQLATGEGKTLVAVLPVILNALAHRGVHVFTANDYLARRDAEWMGPVYRFLGLEVGVVGQEMGGDDRRQAYGADITYVTAKEAGFDFLRDRGRGRLHPGRRGPRAARHRGDDSQPRRRPRGDGRPGAPSPAGRGLSHR
jgi:preprotein translocase subunit SecA